MKKTAVLILAILIMSLFTACSFLPLAGDKNDNTTKDVTSSDGQLQLTVPSSFKETKNLNDVANLQLMNVAKEQYTVTIYESKIDLSDDFTLDDYLDIIKQNMSSSMDSPDFSDVETKTIGGIDARQYTLSGEIDKIKLKYLVTLLETDKGFYQIISWSLPSRFDDALEVFQKTADSFKEL